MEMHLIRSLFTVMYRTLYSDHDPPDPEQRHYGNTRRLQPVPSVSSQRGRARGASGVEVMIHQK